ncbi:MAG: beta-lactamase family protein [Bacteroidia bacterium]|nr:beta-lactamase family protein [Bacteroidia bacterium]MBT8267965.1 beta-lactamase family protein [Bacteroidia bacterium]NNK70028.1 beta-lactamase family protein [Flavobacteriaceae bacterium]
MKNFSKLFYFGICLVSSSVFCQEMTSVKPNIPTDWDLQSVTKKIDSIMDNGIRQQAFPGAQLKVWHKGEEIFHKTYGFHTYDSITSVQPNAIYDLASVTKIAGPLLALMKLYEEGKIDLDSPLSKYWKPWRSERNKKHLTLRELLAHQSGLEPYIPMYIKTMKKGQLRNRFFRKTSGPRYAQQVYDNLYVKNRFEKKIYRNLKRANVSPDKKYVYSGIASLIYPRVIEELGGMNYEDYLREKFYGPLGCETLGFNPMDEGMQPIIPTEIDTIFRKTLVKGWVHDENAALFGGISGNAGLFGSAEDLAKLMQMLVQKGEFEGKRYLKESTIDEFIRIQYPEYENRRGLGFDKPLIGNDSLSLNECYPAPEVSKNSFGHSGFTGTFVWADPDHELVFIFLSNRVYPNRSHRKIYELNIRPALQQVFYKHLPKPVDFINN